ncbi:methyltransferase domain-containing protein [bacterium]|nr:MAG: methyltransferase domain-containing protein [bacterium]
MAKSIPASIKASSARELALHVLRDVFGSTQRGAQESLEYRAARATLPPRDLALATELAYGTVKMRRLLEWYLRPYLQERLHTLPEPIRELLYLGAYQLLIAGGIAEHAAVFETVSLARRLGHRGTAGLVNAVLRRIQRERPAPPQPAAFADPDEYLGVVYSYPTWIVRAWRERFGERCAEILEAGNRPARGALSINTLRGTVDEARALLAERGLTCELSTLVPTVLLPVDGRFTHALEVAEPGRWFLQGETAALAAHLLAPRPGQRVFDLCCGRGHKSLQLAALMADRGELWAVDNHAGRLQALSEAAATAGVTCIRALAADLAAPWPAELQQADAILLDAPCSGLGILGRAPEARWRKRPEDPARLAAVQRELLARALGVLAPGGRLVYAVCSTDQREGEGVLEVLAARPDIHEERRLLIPPCLEGRDGFFLAVLTRG